MRRAPKRGQMPRRLQLNATRYRRDRCRSAPGETLLVTTALEVTLIFPLDISRQFPALYRQLPGQKQSDYEQGYR